MSGSQCHDRDRDGGAVHVDRRAERDGHGVHFLVKAELFTQLHVDWNVSGGASCEESSDAALPQAPKDQRIGVALQDDERDQGIHDERHGEHAADQQHEELAVIGED